MLFQPHSGTSYYESRHSDKKRIYAHLSSLAARSGSKDHLWQCPEPEKPEKTVKLAIELREWKARVGFLTDRIYMIYISVQYKKMENEDTKNNDFEKRAGNNNLVWIWILQTSTVKHHTD